MSSYQGELLGWEWESLLAYRNPPFYALLYLPTARLPFAPAFTLFAAGKRVRQTQLLQRATAAEFDAIVFVNVDHDHFHFVADLAHVGNAVHKAIR